MKKWEYASRAELKENIQQIAVARVFKFVLENEPQEGKPDLRIPMLKGMMVFLTDMIRAIDEEGKEDEHS
jgi:hypoxanthine-guanine phosphoribosyltransferase